MNRQYLFSILIGFFWSLLVCLRQFVLFLKRPSKYLCSPKFIPTPEFVYDPSLGKHRTAHLNSNINLHYVESGDPTKPTIIFVHGFPEFWYSWRSQIIEFQKTHRVIAFDMRGYGESDKPMDVSAYKVEHLVNDIRELMDYLSVQECTLVAHDWGGAVSWLFALKYPHLLHRLIILNCPHTVAFRKYMRSTWKQFLMSWYMFFFQIPWLPEYVISRFDYQFIEQAFKSKQMGLQLRTMSDKEVDAYLACISRPGGLTCPINFYRASFRYRNSQWFSDLIQSTNGGRLSTNLPVLLIWGDKDGALSKKSGEMSADYVPNFEMRTVEGASHWVQQDAPGRVNELMKEFINKTGGEC